MQVYVSNREIEQIAEGLVRLSCGQPPPKRIDIDGIAAFLGLSVIYEHIAEQDRDKIGFVSDGATPRSVFRDGAVQRVVFPRDTIVLEHFLQFKSEECRRRFVLAHEIGHVLLGRADPAHAGTCFNRLYDTERSYSITELHERMNLAESQANMLAGLILMPPELMAASVRRHFRRRRIPVYGDCVFLPQMKPTLEKMSSEIGVSYSAMLIQLRKYGLLEQRDMKEYFKKTMSDGRCSIE